MELDQCHQVVASALDHGITTLEAGQEGGDHVLLNAYLKSSYHKPDGDPPLTMTMRLGYRT
eukprot:3273645-Ditylum_brightwellii.AAC.1